MSDERNNEERVNPQAPAPGIPPACAVVRELLPAYLEKQAGSPQRVTVEDHLLSCDDCKDVLESHVRVWEAMDHWQVADPGPNFAGAVLAAAKAQGLLPEPKPKMTLARLLFRPLVPAWAAVLLVAVGIAAGVLGSPALGPWLGMHVVQPSPAVLVGMPDTLAAVQPLAALEQMKALPGLEEAMATQVEAATASAGALPVLEVGAIQSVVPEETADIVQSLYR